MYIQCVNLKGIYTHVHNIHVNVTFKPNKNNLTLNKLHNCVQLANTWTNKILKGINKHETLKPKQKAEKKEVRDHQSIVQWN